MFRKSLLFVLVGLLSLCAAGQDGKFTVTGKLKGQGNWANYYLTNMQNEVLSTKTTLVKDDKVDFSFDLEEMGWFSIYTGNRQLYFPAIPGETITINGDIDNYTVDGSSLYREYNENLTAIRPLLQEIWKYDFKQECQGEIAGKSSEEVFDSYQSKLRENYKPVTEAVLSFIRRYADHESSMMVLDYLNNVEDIERAGDIISEQVLDGRMNPYFKASMARVSERGASLLEKMAPDFNLNDVDGKALSLSSLRGKWVLINFWASSCGNAISRFPAIKEAYAKYKDYVEFLGVDCEDNEAGWKSAVKGFGLPWLNVYDHFGFDDPQSPFTLYDVTALPTFYLISPSGKVAKKGGSADDFMPLFKILFE
jgi:thiol-disulfide isomerase/thioredoxin